MKQKFNPLLSFFPLVVHVGISPLHAADIDTTGGTTVINADAPQNKYLGNGTLQISNDGSGEISLGTNSGNGITEFAMTGGLITIDSGVTFVNGGWQKGIWTNNKSDLHINATANYELWDGNATFVNALSGTGSLIFNQVWGGGPSRDLHVGVNDGGGNFEGAISETFIWSQKGIEIYKNGTGTQTFSNLANQKPKKLVLNDGTVNLLADDGDASFLTAISGPGNITKSGAGVLTLTGSLANTGVTSVSEGTLGVSNGVNANSNFVIATGAVLALNFPGIITVNSLEVGSSGPLPVGIYNSSHPTYGSSFTGTGSLRIQATVVDNSGTWTSLSAGNWSNSANWQGGNVASGIGQTATFSAATGVAVTLDANFTIGHLVFDSDGYTLTGPSPLLLNDALPPTLTVNGSVQSRIDAPLAGTTGFDKAGTGTLTLAGANTISGLTSVSSGRLIFENVVGGNPNYAVQTGAFLEFGVPSGTKQIAGGAISGDGALVKSGGGTLMLGASGQAQTISLATGTLIDVQGGVLRNEYGNSAWSGNRADVNVAGGAFFDIWDGNTTVDAVTGSGTINKGWSANNSLTFGADGGSGSFSGTVSQGPKSYGGQAGGSFNLVKTGTGTQTFTGTTTFNGSLTVSEGTLSLGNGTTNTSLSDTTPVIVGTGATLNLNFSGSDTVASVTLGGTTYTTPGNYGASNHTPFITGSGTLTIPGTGSDYDTWVTAKGVVGGPNDDDDKDGYTNSEEYAFGLVPTSGSSANPIVAQLSNSTGTFSYTRRNSALTTLDYTVWYSTSLAAGSWLKDNGAVEGTPVLVGDVETVPVAISAGLMSNPKLFIQVRSE